MLSSVSKVANGPINIKDFTLHGSPPRFDGLRTIFKYFQCEILNVSLRNGIIVDQISILVKQLFLPLYPAANPSQISNQARDLSGGGVEKKRTLSSSSIISAVHDVQAELAW